MQTGVHGCAAQAVHHPEPPGVQDRAEAVHHPGAGAEVPRQAGGGLPSHRQAEVPHGPGQSGQAGKQFIFLQWNIFTCAKTLLQMQSL